MTTTSFAHSERGQLQARTWIALLVAIALVLGISLTSIESAHAEENATTTLTATRSVTVRDSTPNVPVVGERLLAGGGRQTLLAFDLGAVPSDQIVVSASLQLYKVWGPSTTLIASTVTTPWTEATTYNTRPTIGSEISRTAVGATLNTWYSFDVLSAARAAHDAGSELSVHLNRTANQNASEFLSTRATDASLRPQLVVTYRPLAEAMAEETAALDALARRALYQDISLPASGIHGSSITWSSSDPAHLGADGVVTRPTDADAPVTLTATLQQSGTTLEHAIDFVVRRIVDVVPEHPQIYTEDSAKDALIAKLASQEWANESVSAIEDRIQPYVDTFAEDPTWLTSRMSMYWQEGSRCTQVYIVAQNFGRCEGDAPVPTVRYPGMRQWNANNNAPLADRIPYSADGSMLNQDGVVVPYGETGHMVRANNVEILTIAKEAAFLYWLEGDDSYAELAAAVYWQWLLGTYFMNPPLDPTQSLGGLGGYAAGGIGGYYDSEVIHDDLGGIAATIYDFLFDYLEENPSAAFTEHVAGQQLVDVASEVSKRFIEIGMVRGNRSGNWNTNGWNMIMPAILALETDDYYDDGKGREHYLYYYTTASTQYHEALPDVVKAYDPATGLWPESPVYAFGTVNVLLDMAVGVERAGVDTLESSPILEKAALSVVPWLDARGNLVVFGDGRGGSPGYSGLERLHSYYVRNGDTAGASQIAAALGNAIDAGNYDRSAVGLIDILDGVALTASESGGSEMRSAYSPFHRHITMKNGDTPADGLMATLYGGYPQTSHLNEQGLALQLYGEGYALSPQAKSYESYWSADYVYSRGVAGANTVVPGYTHGEISINAMEPAVPAEGLTDAGALSASQQFTDVSAGAETRRTVGVVRTSPGSGFYVDVFRADQLDSDYLWHAVGDDLQLLSADGDPLVTNPDALSSRASGYEFFTNTESVTHDGDFRAQWTTEGRDGGADYTTDMWMLGQDGRTLFTADGLPTTSLASLTPYGVSSGDDSTPTLVVRQDGNDASSSPYVAVFEQTAGDTSTVTDVQEILDDGSAVAISITSSGDGVSAGRTDLVVSSTDAHSRELEAGTTFAGTYGVVSTDDAGLVSLYLGEGTALSASGVSLTSADPVSANLERTDSGFTVGARGAVTVGLPVRADTTSVRVEAEVDGAWTAIPATLDETSDTVAIGLSAGEHSLRVVERNTPLPTSAPSAAVLSNTSGWASGLHDGNFSVVLDLWWGVPGESVTLYENGTPIETRELEPSGTSQKVVFPLSGRGNGSYTYSAVLANPVGSTPTTQTTVNVTHAAPSRPVVSHDNWDQDGTFTLKGDLWWGTNATSYEFLIDGAVVSAGNLTARTPSAQTASAAVVGLAKGNHLAEVVFTNAAGSARSVPVTISVTR